MLINVRPLVASARTSRLNIKQMPPRLSGTQKLFKLSVLAHKPQAVQFWARQYVMEDTDTLRCLGKVPAKTSPFCSRLVTDL